MERRSVGDDFASSVLEESPQFQRELSLRQTVKFQVGSREADSTLDSVRVEDASIVLAGWCMVKKTKGEQQFFFFFFFFPSRSFPFTQEAKMFSSNVSSKSSLVHVECLSLILL